MSYAGSSLDDALKRLSAAMAVNNLVGLKEQSGWTSEARVVWTPTRMRYQRPHEQPVDGKACNEVWIFCDVEIRGPDWSAFETVANKLQVALYEEFSENTFERSSDVTIDGGEIDAQSFGGLGQIGLLFPVYVHKYGKANIVTIEQIGTVSGPLGNEDTIT